jgi:predicted nucleic acid-binding Zn ribbon protein
MEAVLSELGLGGAAAAYRVGRCWEEAVGADVARHCRPLGLRGHILQLEVESSVWSQQLQLQQGKILTALRDLMGDDAPRELRFQVGSSHVGS